ncbi:MAG: hypothetical protein AAGJ79_01555 [Verrucomicrobiota bacterium]
MTPERNNPVRHLVLGAGIAVFSGFYFFLATILIQHTNQDRERSDQQNNIRLAHEAKEQRESPESWRDVLPHHTDGVVNPLWPWTASFLIDEGESDRDIFVQGKWLNTVISGAGLVFIALYLSRRWSLFGVFTFLFLVGFGAFLKRGTYFQPEPLSFLLILASWICALQLLERPRIPVFALLGLFSGFAYLAKSSIQVLLLGFFGVLVLQVALAAFGKGSLPAKRCLLLSTGGAALSILVFLAIASPRLLESQEKFGSAFHSWPALWMWNDTFEEGAALMTRHPDPATIPAEEKPSFGNYIRNAEEGAPGERMSFGLDWTMQNFFHPTRARVHPKNQKPWKRILPDRGNYLYGLASLAVGLALLFLLLHRKGEGDSPGDSPFPVAWFTKTVFVLGTFASYTLAYSWYAIIGKGDRFLLSLYGPLVLSLIWAADALARWFRDQPRLKLLYPAYGAAMVTLLVFVALRLFQLASFPEFYTK